MKRQHRLYEWKDGKKLELGERSLVMGILNVTPDSFSDGGKWNSNTLAVSHATDMIKDGAHLIDVGAESTRPGHVALTPEEETKRLMQFLPDVLKVSMVPVSVDSYHYETMETALKAGAHIVNDIWGFQYDDGSMAKTAAAFDVPVILMHNQETEVYGKDMMDDLKHFFDKSIEIALPPASGQRTLSWIRALALERMQSRIWKSSRGLMSLLWLSPAPGFLV